MVTNTIFREITQLHDELESEINKVYKEDNDVVKLAEKSLILIDNAVRKVKEMISSHHFDTIAQEIHFFKKIKPKFISKFIYHSTILDIESHKPNAGIKIIKEYYEAEQEKLKNFYTEQSEFYSYYRRDATYLDHKIFVRNSYDLKMKLSFGFYNFDTSFTTSHDHLVARFIANQLFDEYLKESIANLSENRSNKILSPLVWSASKVSLTELLFALHLSNCFNAGHTELSEIFRWAEKSFDISLGNYHKTLGEIRLRKTDRSKFLNLLRQNLNQHLDDLDI
ncbi:RteC protein [Chryseobacterium shigense]|uniref:RteC protein n=1 Tax=Chryseobacterium shigense TaxID=297244 RepID=A0A1N7I842_9FLAO|nr:RteC domain-containing protein [Chryseobacterium shigense]PQA97005.1 RteC protein [Chryseobacterium shigense]SIS33237.1 RteC protein [Chryseobacterium shigense]